jgi:uncharacterized protein (UPF0332 family)
LLAVWLYGSRARGEIPHDEDSDVDVLVVARGGRKQTSEPLRDAIYKAAEEEGVWPNDFHIVIWDPAWLAHRRAIECFLAQEIDRDKAVLYGGGDPAPTPLAQSNGSGAQKVRLRTEEFLGDARKALSDARLLLDNESPDGTVSRAYYAMLYAARAALSEEDLHAKTHPGVWHLFNRTFVESGRIPARLHKGASGTQPTREYADYAPGSLPMEVAENSVALATEFFDAVIELIGADPESGKDEPAE